MLGALNLFRSRPGPMANDDLVVAQALADVAAIGLVQHRAGREAQLLAEQLNLAVHSRIAIEQAKGVLAERLQLAVDEAFSLMRGYARDHNLPIHEVAGHVVNGALPASRLL